MARSSTFRARFAHRFRTAALSQAVLASFAWVCP